MRAEIKRFEWEVTVTGNPAETVQVVMHIGPLGAPGDETFSVSVCTPEALARLLDRDGIVLGRHLLLVNHVDTRSVEAFLEDRLQRIDGDNWNHLAQKISRIAYWEFEDYTPWSS